MLLSCCILILFFFYFGIIVECSHIRFEKPIVIAHRGASAYLPEHTLEAKIMAYAMGSDYLEQDLVLTKDYVPIVFHDIYLEEATDVANKFPKSRARDDNHYYVIDFTIEEIKTLKVTERLLPNSTNELAKFPLRFPLRKSSFQINTFKEEIELVQGLQKSLMQSSKLQGKVVGIYPEIKDPYFHFKEDHKNFSEIVLEILAEYNYKKATDPVFLQCFDPFELIRIRRELKSELKIIQLLTTESNDRINYTYWNSEDGLRNISTFAQGICPEIDQLVLTNQNVYLKQSELAVNAKSFGLLIHTFLSNTLPPYASSRDELTRIFAIDVQVDGLFTDFPDLAVDFINRIDNS